MTPRELMAAFDVVADAPDGIKRLRELVLSLAVRGKLVGQDEEEDSAVLLHNRERRHRNGFKHQDSGPMLTPFDIPAGWTWMRLGAATHDLGSKSPDRPFTYVDVGSIDNQRGVIGPDLEVIQPSSAPSRARKLVNRGCVLYSTIRPYLLNIATVEQDFEPAPIVSTAFAVLNPCEGLLSRYLYFLLRSPFFVDYVSAVMKGVAYPAISDRDLLAAPIPIPPLAEQHRIVARVDELMALLDRLESTHKARDEARRAARAAALAALRDAEDADAVETAWARIAGEMGEMLVDVDDVASIRQVVLQLAVGGLLVPCTIRWTPLAKLLREPLANGRSVPDGTGYPVLRLTALRGEVVDTKHQKLGSWEAREGCRFRIEAGDLLVVRGNGSKALVARSAMVLATEEVAFPDTAIRLRPDLGQVTQRYLYYAWEAPQTRAALEERAKTTAGIWKVSQDDLYGISLPVPDLPEQHRIVARVDALLALCDTLEARLRAARELHAQLAAAAVHHLDV